MVEGLSSMKLREVITIASPQPNGQIPIGNAGDKDQLQRLLLTIGFDYLTMAPKDVD